MISECKSGYIPLPESSTLSENFSTNIAIPDDETSISANFTVTGNKTIEWLGLTLTSDHTYAGDLEIYLTSPFGTTSRLMLGNNSGLNYSMASGFRYGSVAFMGEMSAGQWTVTITDQYEEDTGTLQNIKFEVFGH